MDKVLISFPVSPLILSPLRKIYKLTPLRGALVALVISCATGCTVVQEKGARYVDIAEKFWNADNVRVEYKREGDVTSGLECRCFGEACKQPPFVESSRISDN